MLEKPCSSGLCYQRKPEVLYISVISKVNPPHCQLTLHQFRDTLYCCGGVYMLRETPRGVVTSDAAGLVLIMNKDYQH